jgi:serine/threonine protein kinase
MRPKDPFIGRTILDGQFEIIQKIGTGGMGSVYKASQPAMNRMVAIKILHPKLAGRKDLTSRFRREARAMSQLTHPNTTKVFMYGELPEDGSLYIVMEFLDGRNLNQTVRKGGPMPVERAVPILISVCGALHEAHGMGIVHRDLKPENIFLCKQGGMSDYAKVLDFGLAKVTERQMRPGSIILTQEGMVFGTPEFMSPEQAQGKTLDPRSDIYSLAVILYEVLTGKLPFRAKTPMEYIQKHVLEEPIALDHRVEGMSFPAGLWEVVHRALAKKPEDRFQTASEFAAALEPFGAPTSRLPAPTSQSPSTPRPGGIQPDATHAPQSPVAAPVAAAPANAAPLPHATPPGGGTVRQVSVGLLIGVAMTFLLVGVVLAVLVMRLLESG